MPNGKKKPNKKSAGKRSHRALNSELRALGAALRYPLVALGKHALKPLTVAGKAKPDFFLQIKASKAITSERFGRDYRDLLKRHDELLSTSSVRELMLGVLTAKKPLSGPELEAFNRLFNLVSDVRLPTNFSGYALSASDKMQHPTAPGTGYFADSTKTMSRHNELDRQRKQHVTDEMQDALKKPDATPDSVIGAGLRAAIAFTLNEFTAPITASDVRPHALRGKAKEAELDEQVRARETVKSWFVKLGGEQESDGGKSAADRRRRPWGPRRGQNKRSVSPPRF